MKSQTSQKQEEPKKTEKEKLREIIQKMVESTYLEQPDNVPLYFMNWLKKEKGFTSSGLTLDQSDELGKLRLQMNRYRELDELNKNQIQKEEEYFTDEDPDEIDEELDKEDVIKAKMAVMQRKAISSEAYGETLKEEEYTPKVVEKPEELVEEIKNRLLRLFHFDNFGYEDILKVIELMYEKKVFKDGTLIQQGVESDTLYLVTQGSFDCFKVFEKGQDPMLVKILYKGDVVGELGLLYKSPFLATVKALEDSVCWCLDRAAYNYIKKQSYKARKERHANLLKNVELFKELKPEEIELLVDKLKIGIFSAGESIFKEGQFGDILYIIEEGSCYTTKTVEPGKPEKEIKTYNAGEYFGEIALVCGDIREETLIAKTDFVKLISIDKKTMRNVLGASELLFKAKYEQEMEKRAKILEEKRKEHKRKRREQMGITEESNENSVNESMNRKNIEDVPADGEGKEEGKEEAKEGEQEGEHQEELKDKIQSEEKEEEPIIGGNRRRQNKKAKNEENDNDKKSEHSKKEEDQKNKEKEDDKKSHHSKKEDDKKSHHSKKEKEDDKKSQRDKDDDKKSHFSKKEKEDDKKSQREEDQKSHHSKREKEDEKKSHHSKKEKEDDKKEDEEDKKSIHSKKDFEEDKKSHHSKIEIEEEPVIKSRRRNQREDQKSSHSKKEEEDQKSSHSKKEEDQKSSHSKKKEEDQKSSHSKKKEEERNKAEEDQKSGKEEPNHSKDKDNKSESIKEEEIKSEHSHKKDEDNKSIHSKISKDSKNENQKGKKEEERDNKVQQDKFDDKRSFRSLKIRIKPVEEDQKSVTSFKTFPRLINTPLRKEKGKKEEKPKQEEKDLPEEREIMFN